MSMTAFVTQRVTSPSGAARRSIARGATVASSAFRVSFQDAGLDGLDRQAEANPDDQGEHAEVDHQRCEQVQKRAEEERERVVVHLRRVVKLLGIAALLSVGVLAILGLTPAVPQSVVIAAFFGGGAVTLVHMGRRRSA